MVKRRRYGSVGQSVFVSVSLSFTHASDDHFRDIKCDSSIFVIKSVMIHSFIMLWFIHSSQLYNNLNTTSRLFL